MQHNPGFLKIGEEARMRVQEVDVESTYEQLHLSTVYIIDVREDHEWLQGHIEGASHIGRGIIERDIEKLIPEKAAAIILYCGGGYRSALAADNLQKMGYSNVYSMSGGFKAWVQAGYPTTVPKS